MSKLAQSASKYTIHADFRAKGVVEKPDVIGAIFGQTEGLLGVDMDLRELQRTGRVGRILVKIVNKEGKSNGNIEIPSSLDASETALIAAALETIERVGPCDAEMRTTKVEDVRTTKRKYLVERAKEILGKMIDEGMPDIDLVSEQIKESVRASEIIDYMGLAAGPTVPTQDSIIMVEGRADVVNLLKNGIKNAIAVGGTNVPKSAIDVSQQKTVTVFVDGDRGGDLIVRELTQKGCDIDFVAKAITGKEVEELTKKEIHKCLREKTPTSQAKNGNGEKKFTKPTTPIKDSKPQRSDRRPSPKPTTQKDSPKPAAPIKINDEKVKAFKKTLEEIVGSRAAYLYDNDMNVLGKVPVKEMFSAVGGVKDAKALVFDGAIDQKLVNFASEKGIKYVLGMKKDSSVRVPKSLIVVTQE